MNGERHYRKGKIQPLHLIESQKLDFREGNIIKYVVRYKHSETPLKDLLDARAYLNRLIREVRACSKQ